VSEDLIQTLTRFHREVVMPDVVRVIDRAFEEKLTPFRDEVLTNFDAVYKRFDDLAIEYQALKGGMIRLEQRMDRLEKTLL